MKQLSLKEANELLKAGKTIRQLSPETITIRKMGRDLYELQNVEQKVRKLISGQWVVNIIRCNTFYDEKEHLNN